MENSEKTLRYCVELDGGDDEIEDMGEAEEVIELRPNAELQEALDALSNHLGASTSEVILIAITLLERVIAEEAQGNGILFTPLPTGPQSEG